MYCWLSVAPGCRYAYVSHPLIAREMKGILAANVDAWKVQLQADGQRGSAAVERTIAQLQQRAVFPWQDDAFHTVLQWLYSRIPDTR